jgi:hypothetical protein
MAKQGNIVMRGKSGGQYCFQSWPLRTPFRSLGAVYCITKRVFANSTYHRAHHEVICVGQTSNMADPLGYIRELSSFEKQGANCICVYPAADEEYRIRIAKDLEVNSDSLLTHWLAAIR